MINKGNDGFQIPKSDIPSGRDVQTKNFLEPLTLAKNCF